MQLTGCAPCLFCLDRSGKLADGGREALYAGGLKRPLPHEDCSTAAIAAMAQLVYYDTVLSADTYEYKVADANRKSLADCSGTGSLSMRLPAPSRDERPLTQAS